VRVVCFPIAAPTGLACGTSLPAHQVWTNAFPLFWPPSVLQALFARGCLVAKRAEHNNPPRGKFLEVDGVRLHYMEQGDGEPLVLLHGNGSMIQDFASSGLLDKAAHKYRVIAFDRPGFGYSERPRLTVWTPGVQADLIRKALGQIGISQAVVLGHSLGSVSGDSARAQGPQAGYPLDSRLGILLSNLSRRRSSLLAGDARDRRHHKLHPLAYFGADDVASADEQNLWTVSGPQEVRRISERDGSSSLAAPRQRCRVGSHGARCLCVAQRLRGPDDARGYRCRRG
jgi:hypothetical protein